MNSAKLATPVSDEDHAQGPADAVLTWVQYDDFECPYTRLSRHSVHQLQREFSDSLRFVFRHFPWRTFTRMHAARTMIALEGNPNALQRRLPNGWELSPYSGDDLHGSALRGANMPSCFRSKRPRCHRLG
jgi:hypothetical protein